MPGKTILVNPTWEPRSCVKGQGFHPKNPLALNPTETPPRNTRVVAYVPRNAAIAEPTFLLSSLVKTSPVSHDTLTSPVSGCLPQHHQNRHTPQSPRRKRGLDLELESPGDSSAPTAAAAAGKARAATKAKKPSTRSRRGAGRTRTTTAAAAGSRGSSADPAGNAEAPEPAIASRRKAPAARKTRAARGYGAGSGSGSAAAPIEIVGEEEGFISSDAEGGRVQASPTARRNRDRSPSRRGAGRPDRWADRGGGGGGARKPSSPLSSPLRPITNYTSEGDRQPRTRAKVRGWRDDGWVGECACYACGEGCLLGIATLYCCATAVHRGGRLLLACLTNFWVEVITRCFFQSPPRVATKMEFFRGGGASLLVRSLVGASETADQPRGCFNDDTWHATRSTANGS